MKDIIYCLLLFSSLLLFESAYPQTPDQFIKSWKGTHINGYKYGKWEDNFGNYRIYKNDTVIECKELNLIGNYYNNRMLEHECKFSNEKDTFFVLIYDIDENKKNICLVKVSIMI